MSDPAALVLSVGEPVPPELRLGALGAALVGAPDALYLVVNEPMSEAEMSPIRRGEFVVGIRLVKKPTVGLAWHFHGNGLGMRGFAGYSLAPVREQLGPEAAEEYLARARAASLAGAPDCGLPLYLVFTDPDDSAFFGLRAFTLPRLFSDRFLRAIASTAGDTAEHHAAACEDAFALGADIWSRAEPGVAVAGESEELTAGEWESRLRRERRRRR